jgi:hypothetical protein
MHFFPNGTKEQYETSIAAVHPAGGGLPECQISRGRRVGWRLDDRRDPRLQGELVKFPRRHPYAPNERGH